jgi:hypothetical protein
LALAEALGGCYLFLPPSSVFYLIYLARGLSGRSFLVSCALILLPFVVLQDGFLQFGRRMVFALLHPLLACLELSSVFFSLKFSRSCSCLFFDATASRYLSCAFGSILLDPAASFDPQVVSPSA